MGGEGDESVWSLGMVLRSYVDCGFYTTKAQIIFYNDVTKHMLIGSIEIPLRLEDDKRVGVVEGGEFDVDIDNGYAHTSSEYFKWLQM